MRIEDGIKLDFKDVLFRPKRSVLKSRSEVDLTRTYTFKHTAKKWNGVPIMAANMDTVGTFEMHEAFFKHKMFTCMHKHYSAPDWLKLADEIEEKNYDYLAVSTGTSNEDHDQLKDIISRIPSIEFICIDVANGYSEHFADFVKKVRDNFQNKTIIAGNVVTGEMTEELILSGADLIKVGIGSGSVCTTRIQTGVGYPQLSAVIECADAAHGLGGHIISDGGCTCAGDVAKAFGGGADFVMLGGMLAGYDETAGELVTEGDKQYKAFYGMSSDTAMDKYFGGVADYRSSEGRTVKIEYKGSVDDKIRSTLGGLRSTCTYIGARRLKELSKCTTFVRVSQQFNSSLI
ncbi:MAG: GMP reductase [Alphaproteobacteria bacterium]|nr:GMP reductase [Alphaproteobacteria bacterium]